MYLLFKLGARSLALLPGRNKVLGWIKQGGGLDWASGCCVCHLRYRASSAFSPSRISALSPNAHKYLYTLFQFCHLENFLLIM